MLNATGDAKDYVEGMWRILQHSKPDDFVLGTGVMHTIRTFVEAAFNNVGTKVAWSGSGVDEFGREAETVKVIVQIDPRYFGPTEVEHLLADPTKAREEQGWTAATSFQGLVDDMMEADLKQVASEAGRKNRHD